MVVKPRLLSCYHATVSPGEGVFLLSERGNRHLRGDAVEALVPLLDGTRTGEEIARALAPQFSAPEVFYVLLELRKAGYVTDGPRPAAPDEVYWESLGTTAADAQARLGATSFEVRSVGGGHGGSVSESLTRSGLLVRPDGDILIVLVSDYLEPGLGEIDRSRRAAGRLWLLARLVGTNPWIGPLFIPGETACWFCLQQRLAGNRPMEEMIRLRSGGESPPVVPMGFVPASLEAAMSLLSARLTRWIGTGQADHLAGLITTIDPGTTAQETHRVQRRPQCPECGDAELYTRRLLEPVRLVNQMAESQEGGSRVVDPEESARRFETLVSPITGVVRDMRSLKSSPGSPVHVYTASHAGPALSHPRAAFYGVAGEAGAGGKGLTDRQARASALGEAIERASAVFQGDEVSVRASFLELDGEAVHPNECMLFSDAQYRAADAGPRQGGMHAVPYRFDPTVTLDWTAVWSMTEERHKYLTTQSLYFVHPGPVEHTFSFADSNGNATGNTREEAVLQGLLELVERDAVAIWWYNRLRMPGHELAGVREPRLRALLDHYTSLGREVVALDLTSDLGIPVYAAISRMVGGGPEGILVGFGAHFDRTVALGRAVTEMNQVLSILERLEASRGRIPKLLEEWLGSGSLADHPHLAPLHLRPLDLGAAAEGPTDILRLVDACRSALEAAGLEVLVLDQTRPDLQIPAVKAIVPGLRHFWARFAPGRLYDVPVSMGLLDEAQGEGELNPLPMFL